MTPPKPCKFHRRFLVCSMTWEFFTDDGKVAVCLLLTSPDQKRVQPCTAGPSSSENAKQIRKTGKASPRRGATQEPRLAPDLNPGQPRIDVRLSFKRHDASRHLRFGQALAA